MSASDREHRLEPDYDAAAAHNAQQHDPRLQHAMLGPGGLSAMAQSQELLGLQMKAEPGGAEAEGMHEIAARGTAGGGGPLPHGERIQAAFGRHDISGVRAHVGGAAEQAAMLMNAQAYATGQEVAFARQPDLHTAAHEAAHVVQQRGGVSLKGGVGKAGDAHERHADAVADAVVAGHSAECLLDAYAGSGHSMQGVQRQAAGPAASPAVPVAKSLDDLVAVLGQAKTKPERTAAATALTDWCRENLVDDAKLAAFLARPDIDAEEKTRILGKLRVAVARNEFLLGWSYHGGVDSIGADGWETTPVGGKTPRNKGPYPSHYLGEVNAADSQEWCTSFAGQAHGRLGFSPGARDPKVFGSEASYESSAGSVFWSGSRLYKWVKSGEDIAGRQLTDPAQALAKGEAGSMLIDYHAWGQLGRRLGSAKKDERGSKVDDVLAKRGTPQAGDVLLLGKDNDFKRGKSHTALIESYDDASHTIYTVEGNTDHAVKGRRFDLTDENDVSQIIAVVRVGAGFFGAGSDAGAGTAPQAAAVAPQAALAGPAPNATPGAPGAKATAPKASGPSGDDLVKAIEDINRKIAAVARAQKWLKGDSDDASAYSLGGGKDAPDATVN